MFSERLTRSSSQKLRKKSHSHGGGGGLEGEETDGEKWKALRCLSLYGLGGGGCKVGADTDTTGGEEYSGDSNSLRRRSSAASHEAKTAAGPGYKSICGTYHGVKDNHRFWKRHINNNRNLEEDPPTSNMDSFFLPDDILEMCLARLPLTALASARLVCRKWNRLSTTARFLEMRREGRYRNIWVFIFGAVKDGFCSGEIHALDVSMERWHQIDSSLLRGRFAFSVATVREQVFVVGGCSSLSSSGRVDRSSFKTHKGVISFAPIGRSWKKLGPMKHARSAPVLGVFVPPRDFVLGAHSHQARRPRTRLASSDIYEDPHRLSLRRHDEASSPPPPVRKSSHRSSSSTRPAAKTSGKRFLLISIGGRGSWDEPLDSGEIYDSASNKWTEIQRVPADFGSACSGAVCNGVFYVYSDTDKLAGYDLEKGFWVRVETRDPSPPRVLEYHPKLVACDGRIFMLSVSWCEGDGQIGRRNKAVRKLWELEIDLEPSWAEVSVHPDAPMDWNAAFVADRGSIFGVEMFKIFGQVLDFLTVCDVVSGRRRGMKWSHVSKNRVGRGHEFDASSCVTKSMAVLHL